MTRRVGVKGKKKIIINCLLIIIGSFLGAYLVNLLMPELKIGISVPLGVSIGIILGKYVIKRKDK